MASPEPVSEASGIDNDDSVAEEFTSAQLIERLEKMWLNEKFAPELLDYRGEIVECVLEQLAAIEENLKRVKKGDIRIGIHRMEVDRIRYVLTSYLRTRLMKIESQCSHILQAHEALSSSSGSDRDRELVSPEELAYAQDYYKLTESHLTNTVARTMPPNMQTIDPKLIGSRPLLDNYVFFLVNKSTEGVLIDEEAGRETVEDLAQDDQHLMRYRPIAPLVHNDSVSLF